jgi:hypothetical protein
MTLDRLLEEFKCAVEQQPWSSAAGYDARRAGIRAVVTALRDEIVNKNSRCGWCLANGDLSHVNDTINEILASDGVEAEAANE